MTSPANPLVGPAPSVKNKGSFWNDLKDVRTVGGWVGTALTVISVLSLGLPGVIKFLTDKLSETIEFWQSILVTAPLTAAIAVIGVCLLRKWLRDWRWLLLFSVGTVAAASWLASCFDNPGAIDLYSVWNAYSGASWPSLIIVGVAVLYTFLQHAWVAYGGTGYYSALVVGGFLAWAWGAKILPHLQAEKRPVSDSGVGALGVMLAGISLVPVGLYFLGDLMAGLKNPKVNSTLVHPAITPNPRDLGEPFIPAGLTPIPSKVDRARLTALITPKPRDKDVIPALQAAWKVRLESPDLPPGKVTKVVVANLVIEDAKEWYSRASLVGNDKRPPEIYWPAHATLTTTWELVKDGVGVEQPPEETNRTFYIFKGNGQDSWRISFQTPSLFRIPFSNDP
jgi:hypothetical protein